MLTHIYLSLFSRNIHHLQEIFLLFLQKNLLERPFRVFMRFNHLVAPGIKFGIFLLKKK